MAKTQKFKDLPVIPDLTNAKIIGLDGSGNDAQFPVSSLRGDKISDAILSTTPVTPLLGQYYDLVGTGAGNAPSGTYTNFHGVGGTAIVIPTPATGNAILNAYTWWNGTYWVPQWQEKALPVSSGKINTWAPQSYNSGDQVNTLGNDWVANSNTSSTDIPGTSSKWDIRLPDYNNRITTVEGTLIPVLTPIIVTNQYGINPPVAAGTAFPNNAATIGKALTASTLSKLVLYFNAAGSFNLLLVTQNTGNNFTINQTIPLTAVLGTNTFLPAQFGTINLAQNQWVAIQTTTGNASIFYTTVGAATQNYYVAGVATTTQNWNSTTSAKYAGYFETTESHANQVSVDKPYLSPAVQASLTNADLVPTQAAAIAANSAGLLALSPNNEIISKYGYPFHIGPSASFTGSAFPNNAFTIGIVPVVSVLNKLVMRFGVVGTFNLVILSKNPSTNVFTTIQSVLLTALTIGENIFLPSDFGLINLAAGQYVGCQMITGQASTYYTSTTGANNYWFNGTYVSGTSSWTNVSTSMYGGWFEYATPKVLVDEAHLDSLVVAKLNNPQLVLNPRRPVLTYDTGFNATQPADWTVTSGWTFSSNGMLSPTGASDWTQKANQNQLSGPSNEESIRRFKFTPQATGTKFAAGTFATVGMAGSSTKSTLFSISDAENLIKFYTAGLNYWPSEPTIVSSAAMSPLVAGRTYMIEMKRYQRTNTITVYDTLTNIVMGTLTHSTTGTTENQITGAQAGSFIMFNQIGQTLFHRVTLSNACYNPRVYIMGDSISEGLTVNLSDRWGQFIFNSLKGSAALNGLSGSKMNEIPQKLLYDIPAMKPQWIISYFNHNDGDGAGSTVISTYNQLMTYCQTNGINLAVCCLAPQPSSNYAAFNTYVLSLPSWVRKVRMDLALTTNHDGVTYNAALYNDAHHPNAAGNLLEFNRVMMDIPELFY